MTGTSTITEAEQRQRRLATLAVSQATHASAHLMEVALEGAQGSHSVFNDEVIELLADALKMAIEIEQLDPEDAKRLATMGGDPGRDTLHAALLEFLKGWR